MWRIKRLKTIKRGINAAILVLIATVLSSCSITKYVPTETETKVVYRDSLIYRTDTVSIQVPVEKIVEVVPMMDTLYMENTVAEAEAFVDTTLRVLRGNLTSKDVKLEKEIQYVDRVVYRDSVVVKEVPVEVEKIEYKTPKWAWYTIIYALLTTFVIGLYITLKFK